MTFTSPFAEANGEDRSRQRPRAKAFRRVMTPPEARLWQWLRARRFRGLKFRRQHPVGPYILDFHCAEAKLAIEVDGAVHDGAEQAEHDRRRTAWLSGRGVRVIRLRATAVRDDLGGVLDFGGSTHQDQGVAAVRGSAASPKVPGPGFRRDARSCLA
ncbi:MAG: endonuclease domain-containing protein [Brevundimonas sp.]|nr:endonuclease domain-containing protein [Brevundimonas sp.]MDI1326067.1 endonuclease domain-containing protein [Brevundimonas sp.]